MSKKKKKKHPQRPRPMRPEITIAEATELVAKQAEDYLGLEDAARQVAHMTGQDLDLIIDTVETGLHESPWLLPDPDCIVDAGFIPRHHFFDDARFLIALREEEAREGFLFPGHRFLPFVAPARFPAEIDLVDLDGRSFPQRVIQRAPEAVAEYLLFFNPQDRAVYGVYETQVTSGLQVPAVDGCQPYRVFDLRDFLAGRAAQEGDLLLATVVDWRAGRIALEFKRAAEWAQDAGAAGAWRQQLEAALERVFDELGPLARLEDQLAWMYWFAGPETLNDPAMALGLLINQSQTVRRVDCQGRTILWRTNEDPDVQAAMDDQILAPPPSGLRGSLDDIAQSIGLILDRDDLETYMLDELAAGGRDLIRVTERVLAGLPQGLRFDNPDQESEFWERYENLWNATCAAYDPAADQPNAPLRHRALAIYDRYTIWVRSLDARNYTPEELRGDSLMDVNMMMALIKTAVKLLQPGDALSAAEIARFEALLNELEPQFDALIRKAEAQLPPAARPTLTVVPAVEPRRDLPPATATLQLKITLLDTKPPVWRRVLIPNNYTLGWLHSVIQTSMGWDGDHVHAFWVRDVMYQAIADEPFSNTNETEDEDAVTLAELYLKPGNKIKYEYDFGDGWRHDIKVEKILPLDPDAAYPQCVAGAMACPPDDIGGAWGYSASLAALRDPRKPGHEDAVNWLGEDYDPELFEKDAINKIFATWRNPS